MTDIAIRVENLGKAFKQPAPPVPSVTEGSVAWGSNVCTSPR